MSQAKVIAFPAHRMGEREPWLTRRDLAEHLQVCVKTVDNLVAAGMPSIKPGRFRRFRLSQVEPWLEQRGRS